MLLVRGQDTTVIQRVIGMLVCLCHETVIRSVVGRLVNPTLGGKDIKWSDDCLVLSVILLIETFSLHGHAHL